MKYCTKCGNQLKDNDSFCATCGTEFNEAVEAKQKSKTPIVVILTLLILVLGSCSVYFIIRPTPEKTIKKFEKCYNDLDIDGMIKCLEPSAQSLISGTTALLSGLTGYDINSIFDGVIGVSSYVDNSTKISIKVADIDYTTKTSAIVKVSCHYSTGSEYINDNESIQMVKANGKWYIAVMGDVFNGYDNNSDYVNSDIDEGNNDYTEEDASTVDDSYTQSEGISEDEAITIVDNLVTLNETCKFICLDWDMSGFGWGDGSYYYITIEEIATQTYLSGYSDWFLVDKNDGSVYRVDKEADYTGQTLVPYSPN